MMKSTGIVRKKDKLGRIVLPLETKMLLGFKENEGLEILIDEERGYIILKKLLKSCLNCGSDKNLQKIKSGYYIYNNCIKDLNKKG